MLNEPMDRVKQPKRRSAAGCGCSTFFAVLLFIGLPLMLLYSFGLSPCRDGPCDPYGKTRLMNVAIGVLVAAVIAGLAVWQVMKRRLP
jgi:uncharacterized membrane protein YccC